MPKHSITQVSNDIIRRFKFKGYSQVRGYNRFEYVKRTNNALVVTRERGEDSRIPLSKLGKSIEAVRENHRIYSTGPASLRPYGITHVNSVTWSLLHLLTLEELLM
jgi:hypothetical protein